MPRDWDGDGRTDIVANSIWGKVVWYRNLGKGKDGLPELSEQQPVEVNWRAPLPNRNGRGGLRPEKSWQRSGEQRPKRLTSTETETRDLVMLDHEGYLSLFERTQEGSTRSLQPPKRIFVDEKGTLCSSTPNAPAAVADARFTW